MELDYAEKTTVKPGIFVPGLKLYSVTHLLFSVNRQRTYLRIKEEKVLWRLLNFASPT